MLRGNSRLASPDPLILESPSLSASPILPPPPSYAPRTIMAQRELRRVENQAREPHSLPGPDWAGETLSMLRPVPLSPRGSLQVWEPLPPPSHPSGAPVLSRLHFSSPSCPPHPTWSLGCSSHLLGHRGPPPASGRRPSCGET